LQESLNDTTLQKERYLSPVAEMNTLQIESKTLLMKPIELHRRHGTNILMSVRQRKLGWSDHGSAAKITQEVICGERCG
jgi:hypothetical protein